MILNKTEAETIYSVLCSLNNLGAKVDCFYLRNAIVTLDFKRTISVIGTAIVDDEHYADRSAFATAYGLD